MQVSRPPLAPLSFWQKTGLCALALYNLLGCYGSVWISDEFDSERTAVFAFGLIPLSLFFFASWAAGTISWRRIPVVLGWVVGVQILIASWGQLLLANALLDPKPVTLNTVSVRESKEKSSLSFARKKGGLGWVYRLRW